MSGKEVRKLIEALAEQYGSPAFQSLVEYNFMLGIGMIVVPTLLFIMLIIGMYHLIKYSEEQNKSNAYIVRRWVLWIYSFIYILIVSAGVLRITNPEYYAILDILNN